MIYQYHPLSENRHICFAGIRRSISGLLNIFSHAWTFAVCPGEPQSKYIRLLYHLRALRNKRIEYQDCSGSVWSIMLLISLKFYQPNHTNLEISLLERQKCFSLYRFVFSVAPRRFSFGASAFSNNPFSKIQVPIQSKACLITWCVIYYGIRRRLRQSWYRH